MKTVLLGDVAEKITKGTTPTTYGKSFTESGVNFIKVESITDQGSFLKEKFAHIDEDTHSNLLKRSIIEKNDILLTMAGAIGRVAKVDEDAILPANTNQAVAIIRVKDTHYDNDFIKYFLSSPMAKNQIIGGTIQTAQPNISLSQISKITIPDLAIREQKKIADILGKIDEKTELNRRMNETLEQTGQTLFKHYFMDNPDSKFWPKKKLLDFAEVVTGKGSTKTKLAEGGQYPLYGANGIMGTSDAFLFDEDLIMTGRVGTLGTVRIATGKLWASDNVLVIKPKKYFGYVYSNVQSFDFRSLNRGSTQPLVTQTDLKNQLLTEPPQEILDEFEKNFMTYLRQIQKNDAQNITLVLLRDTLLPRLISGKIKV